MTYLDRTMGAALLACMGAACGGSEPLASTAPPGGKEAASIEIGAAPAASSPPDAPAAITTRSSPAPSAPGEVREPPPPPGTLECRAHDGATTHELWVSFADQGLGAGTLRKVTPAGIEDQPLSVQSWKGSLLLDAPGSKNVMQTRGRLLQVARKLQVGADWNTPWLGCDAR